jgi:hypothetical protein
MSANNQHECDHNECNNETCLLTCIDEELSWKTQDEFDALPDDTIILSQLSMINHRLEKFDAIPILHTKKCITIAIQDTKEYIEENSDNIMIENLYEDIKKYNVKSATNITNIQSRPSDTYAKWRKWITQYIAYRSYKGFVPRGVVLNKDKYFKFMLNNSPFTIMMTNERDNICLMTTPHYYGIIPMDNPKQF